MFTQSHHMISANARPAAEIDARLRRMLFELLGIAILFAIGTGLIAVRVAVVIGRMT